MGPSRFSKSELIVIFTRPFQKVSQHIVIGLVGDSWKHRLPLTLRLSLHLSDTNGHMEASLY